MGSVCSAPNPQGPENKVGKVVLVKILYSTFIKFGIMVYIF